MDALVKAATDFLAAVLSALGVVGRPRRRAGIREDLEVLGQLRDSPDFGPHSAAYTLLLDHITREVARFTGTELQRKRKVPWSGVAFALIVGLPAGYVAYRLNATSFQWLSLLPGALASLMLLALFGMLVGGEQTPHDPNARRGTA